MAYNRNQARALCTASEYALFEASLADRIRQHTPAQLRSKIERTRRTRDKYRDLYKRQRLATRERSGTKKGTLPERNRRTEQKARLFDEALQRLTRREQEFAAQAQRQAAAAKRADKAASARRTAGSRASTSTRAKKRQSTEAPKAGTKADARRKSRSTNTAAGFISPKAASASRRQRSQKTRSHAVQGHVRASGRRTQARRDTRR